MKTKPTVAEYTPVYDGVVESLGDVKKARAFFKANPGHGPLTMQRTLKINTPLIREVWMETESPQMENLTSYYLNICDRVEAIIQGKL